ncbi:3750_t:CDS:2 [Ambispora gerdemannii]|uniref:3750_t:CDS:1 n=1 Tax=Ambispora gerdemannii TaxID=144530 RepID=A0A9N9EIP6_9GLOM|nr:3750_t:CDS:2 [Ambispora gerdemannii]
MHCTNAMHTGFGSVSSSPVALHQRDAHWPWLCFILASCIAPTRCTLALALFHPRQLHCTNAMHTGLGSVSSSPVALHHIQSHSIYLMILLSISTLWKKFDLAKMERNIEDFFKFLKREAIKYNLQKCVKIHGVRSKVHEAIKEILNLSKNSNDDVTKFLSGWIDFADVNKYNDSILSGIFDLRTIPRAIQAHLELRGVWDLFNEEIVIPELPEEIEAHIERVVLNDDDRIPKKYYDNTNYNKLKKEEYRALNNLIRKIMNLWDNPTYKRVNVIMESTWNHDAIAPMIEYILCNVKICRNWENKIVKSSSVTRGKNKKGDFQGYKQSIIKKSYDYELMFEETSYGPNHPNNTDHVCGDRVKLAKIGKVSFESIYKLFPDQYNKQLKDVNIFLIQSHDYHVTFSIMDYRFFPFGRVRSLENIYVPVEDGPNSLYYIKKMIKVLYYYRTLVEKTVKNVDNIDKQLGSFTPPTKIRVTVPVFDTP